MVCLKHLSYSFESEHCKNGTYSVLRGIHVSEGTQRVSDSVEKGIGKGYKLHKIFSCISVDRTFSVAIKHMLLYDVSCVCVCI